jgi:hypothetical protein
MRINWRAHGSLGAALLGLFLAQYIGFSLLGEGWRFGLGVGAGSPLARLRVSPAITIGSGRFHLKAGQAVQVSYHAKIEDGCVAVYLTRFWPFGVGPFSNSLDIQASGDGQGDLIAPAEGWYRIKTIAARPSFCQSFDPSRSVWDNAARGAALNYSLSWKVQP